MPSAMRTDVRAALLVIVVVMQFSPGWLRFAGLAAPWDRPATSRNPRPIEHARDESIADKITG
ncbi:hypothetical protein GCM10009810_29730 [Nostocoides vanveenii]|uniref:Uncharacterized protein n=1 Tax=Nostocoides vanveenii TaxID=330835 RepID=A0ABN2KY49_9MICO